MSRFSIDKCVTRLRAVITNIAGRNKKFFDFANPAKVIHRLFWLFRRSDAGGKIRTQKLSLFGDREKFLNIAADPTVRLEKFEFRSRKKKNFVHRV